MLLERGVLAPGDEVKLDEERLPQGSGVDDAGDEFYKAEVTGKTGRSDNFRWLYDGEGYSATGLAKTVVETITGDRPDTLNGYKYLLHPEFNNRTLSDLRNSGVEASERH